MVDALTMLWKGHFEASVGLKMSSKWWSRQGRSECLANGLLDGCFKQGFDARQKASDDL